MANRNEWNESLCGCCDDCGSCCYGCWCTPCLFGSNAEKIDDSSCFLMCCAYLCLTQCYLCCIPHYMKRKDLRNKYHLRKDPCGDFPVACFCSPCGLCQEARFLKRAGQQQVVMQNTVPHMVQPGGNY